MATFNGSPGDDIFTGGADPDTAEGNGGNDRLSGNGGNDVLAGGDGADELDGGDDSDTLYSGVKSPAFNLPYYNNPYTPPVLDTGTEVDILRGGAGSDRLFAGYGDHVDGGANGYAGDYLYISFLGATSGVTADFRLASQVIGGGTITGIEYISWVQGSNYDDDITLPGYTGGYSDFGAVFGMGGNDRLVAGYETGTLDGGDGNDIVDGRNSQYLQRVYGGAGDDTLYTSSNTFAEAYGGDGNDTIYAHGTIYGGAGNDTIVIQASYYGGRVFGEDGDDDITASPWGSLIGGGAGADVLRGGAGVDILSSAGLIANAYTSLQIPDWDMGLEHDTLTGEGGNDILAIGYGDDADGGAGTDTLRLSLGGLAAGIVFDTAGIVTGQPYSLGGGTIQNIETLAYLRGTNFNDTISVATQASLLILDAGAGNDVITSASSSVDLSGGDGDDRLVSGPAGDIFNGGAGIDTIDYSNAGSGVTVTLAADGLTGTGGGGDSLSYVENVVGSAHADTITGNANANRLDGGDGADILNGGGGVDDMRGGLGDDIYHVDVAGETVIEAADEGIDEVRTGLSTYSLLGTHIENLTATNNSAHSYRGSAANNVIRGGSGTDSLRMQDGGDDSAYGGAGNDSFYFGAAYTAADLIDGGTERDQVALQGNYNLVLGSIAGVEDLILLSGTDTRFGDTAGNPYTYVIHSSDSNVAAGEKLLVDATMLVAGESLTFDGTAETDGKFLFSGGQGTDIFSGGAGADGFYFRDGTFWNAGDRVLGGAGDQIGFRGDFTGANKVVMGANQIVTVETLVLMSGLDLRFGPIVPPTKFDITMHDGNLASGRRFTVDASQLAANETARVDASAETDGTYRMFGGAGADELIGGANADFLRGGLGADILKGNGGADTFAYTSAAQSTSTAFDLLVDVKSAEDRIDLHSAVSGWGSTMTAGQLSHSSFDADLAAALDAALGANQAILFDPTSGDYAGRHFVVVDADGDGAYTAGADYVFELGNAAVIDTSGTGIFA
jgi:Ca2+-binding RTX toxin-like protein